MPTIRFATESDLPATLAIYNEAILHTTASYHYAPLTLADHQEWFRAKQAKNFHLLVAIDQGDTIAGWSSYGPFRPSTGYRFTVENSVYVAAERRGQGIGRALLAPLIDAAREQGHHTMVAGVDANNKASIRLHRSFGFVKVAHFQQVGFKFDRWLDLTFWELLLYQ